MKRNFSNGNVNDFVDKLVKINWETQETDPNNAYNHFYSRVYAIYEECFPMKKIKQQANGIADKVLG